MRARTSSVMSAVVLLAWLPWSMCDTVGVSTEHAALLPFTADKQAGQWDAPCAAVEPGSLTCFAGGKYCAPAGPSAARRKADDRQTDRGFRIDQIGPSSQTNHLRIL